MEGGGVSIKWIVRTVYTMYVYISYDPEIPSI